MEYMVDRGGGKFQLDKIRAFCSILDGRLPKDNESFSSIISILDDEVRKFYPDIKGGALNNAHGDWYEWLIGIAAWNYHVKDKHSHIAIPLPNVTQFDVAKLYENELYGIVTDLREKVKALTNVSLITSNPDLVIIKRKGTGVRLEKEKLISQLSPKVIEQLDSNYKSFIGKCAFDSIVGYISVKSSLRPDRRLQIPHEGSLMKAIYTHIQTRKWILNPPGLKYFAFTTRVGPKDRSALKTVATHSITTVQSLPQAAVDEVFSVDSISEAVKAFDEVLWS